MTTMNLDSLITSITEKRAADDQKPAAPVTAPAAETKQASADPLTPEGIKQRIEDLPPDVKAACVGEALAMLQAADAATGLGTAKAASGEVDFENLTDTEKKAFEDAFNTHSAKLASENPDYARVLNIEAVKMAFDQGAEDAEQDVIRKASEKVGQ